MVTRLDYEPTYAPAPLLFFLSGGYISQLEPSLSFHIRLGSASSTSSPEY
jgi:hypothetical protein